LCGQSIEEFSVKPEQQPVDLALIAVIAVGHVALELGIIGSEFSVFLFKAAELAHRLRMAVCNAVGATKDRDNDPMLVVHRGPFLSR
jgi:hypothetical protein